MIIRNRDVESTAYEQVMDKPRPGHADYAAAKGAILSGLLLSAKNEASRLGANVRVNVVAPGWTVTPMTSEARRDPDLEERVTATR